MKLPLKCGTAPSRNKHRVRIDYRTMPAVPLPLPIFVFIALAALSTILYALRGRRINDHPICRRCLYDLSGKPADSLVCSECGANLSRRRAVRIGAREKRRGLLSIATMVLLVSGGWSTYCGWNIAKTADRNRYFPAWWLVRQAHSASVPARDAALAELARRITEHRLAPAQERALIVEALARQADLKQPWVAGWGTLVESEQIAQRLPEDQWVRYLMQAMQLKLVPARPVFRKCDPLQFWVKEDFSRVGTLPESFESPAWYEVCACTGANPMIHLNGWRVPVSVEQEYEIGNNYFAKANGDPTIGIWREFKSSTPIPGVYPRAAPAYADGNWPAFVSNPGPQTAELKLFLYPNWQDYNDIPDKSGIHWPPAPAAPGPTVVKISCPWILAESPRMITDPAMRARVEHALSMSSVTCISRYYEGRGVQSSLSGTVTIRNPPCDLAFGVKFCKPGTDIEYNSFAKIYVRKGVDADKPIDTICNVTEMGYEQSSVHIRLTAEPSASPMGTTEVWGGTIELRDLPVRQETIGVGNASP